MFCQVVAKLRYFNIVHMIYGEDTTDKVSLTLNDGQEIIFSIEEFERLVNFFEFAHKNRDEFRVISNTLENNIVCEYHSCRVYGFDFLDSCDDIIIIKKDKIELKYGNYYLFNSFSKPIVDVDSHYLNRIQKKMKKIFNIKHMSLEDICCTAILRALLLGKINIVEATFHLPLPALLQERIARRLEI